MLSGRFKQYSLLNYIITPNDNLGKKIVIIGYTKKINKLDGSQIHSRFDGFDLSNGFNEEYAEFFIRYYNDKDFMIDIDEDELTSSIEGLEDSFNPFSSNKVSPLNPTKFDLTQPKIDEQLAKQENLSAQRFMAEETNVATPFDTTKLSDGDVATSINRTEDEYGVFLKNLLKENDLDKKITNAIICSVVVQLTEKIEIALKKYLKLNSFIITHKIKTNVVLKTNNPSQIGADRIANAAAASKLYSCPAIVVDFGTATSFDIVDKNNEFIGGIITAGMKIQAEALSNKTSKLPKLNIETPTTPL